MLDTDTIGLDEVFILKTNNEGTEILAAQSLGDVKEQIEAGFTVSEATFKHTKPEGLVQLDIWEELE